MIFVSDHAFISKWWWIGAIRNTRLPNHRNEITWITTDNASITKIPPTSRSSSGTCRKIAIAPIAPPSAIEPGVAHEDLGREGVEPEKADGGADHRRADVGDVEAVRDPDAVRRVADVDDHGHRGEREERDDRRARGEAVDAVGQVHGVRRAGDDQEDQDVVAPPRERDRPLDDRHEHRVIEAAGGARRNRRRPRSRAGAASSPGRRDRASACAAPSCSRRRTRSRRRRPSSRRSSARRPYRRSSRETRRSPPARSGSRPSSASPA